MLRSVIPVKKRKAGHIRSIVHLSLLTNVIYRSDTTHVVLLIGLVDLTYKFLYSDTFSICCRLFESQCECA